MKFCTKLCINQLMTKYFSTFVLKIHIPVKYNNTIW